MTIELEPMDDMTIVHLSGHFDGQSTGDLCDALVAEVRKGRRDMLVDCAPGTTIARTGFRGLVIAASLVRAGRGSFRIVADAELESWLRKVSFTHLFSVHHSRESALAMFGKPQPPAPVAANTPHCPSHLDDRRLADVLW
ncbi:STAS domain-containing protein [Chachezhania antarctica]|uniref:STAS domain-containing protein n=1 Tax=Chachezhania antarctica TaxID=2340860 RepID=UPI000EB2A24B|nr:hypothetical protein [Chachezhania antarctica]